VIISGVYVAGIHRDELIGVITLRSKFQLHCKTMSRFE